MMNYAIAGGVRLARHFPHYFQSLEIPHTRWTQNGRSPVNFIEAPEAALTGPLTRHDQQAKLEQVS